MKNNDTNILSLPFELDVEEDGWPPVAVEHLLVDSMGENDVKIRVAPFFVQDLSVGDVITVDKKGQASVSSWFPKHLSQRSTVWVLSDNFEEIENQLTMLKNRNCNVERLRQFGLISLDVAEDFCPEVLESILSQIEDTGAHVAYPSFRHSSGSKN